MASFVLRWAGADRRLKVAGEFGFTAGLLALFIAPWSMAMFRSTGTFLYPLLGQGNHLPSAPEQGMPFGLLSRYEMVTASAALLTTPLVMGFRFVAYDYAAEGGFSRNQAARRLSPYSHPWVRDVSRRTLDFQDNLSALARTRRHIYDDGRTFVLDVAQREPPWTLSRLEPALGIEPRTC